MRRAPGGPILAVLAPLPAWAQPQHFSDVPVLVAPDPAPFRAWFDRARCHTVRLLMLGDSQETSPGGKGGVYVPRFNHELASRFANAPESPFVELNASTGDGQPFAEWLVRALNAAPGVSPSRLDPGDLPPGISACATSTPEGTSLVSPQLFGQLLGLQPDARDVDWRAQLAGIVPLFRVGEGVYLDVLVATGPESGEVLARARPGGPLPSYANAITQSWVTGLSLDDPGPREFRRQRLGPFAVPPGQYLWVELAGDDPSAWTDIVTARFASSVDRSGIVVTDLAAGGYTARSLPTLHAGSGPAIAALEPDGVVLCFGANDCVAGRTSEQFAQDLSDLVAFVRGATRADLPVLLVGDVLRMDATPAQLEELDRYPWACAQVALGTPGVAALNIRRLTAEAGWTPAAWTQYMNDRVHYNGAGAILKAALEVSTLWDAFASPCAADVDDGSGLGVRDCGVTIDDALFYLLLLDSGNPRADLDDGSGAGTPDGGVTIDDLLYFLARFDQGC